MHLRLVFSAAAASPSSSPESGDSVAQTIVKSAFDELPCKQQNMILEMALIGNRK